MGVTPDFEKWSGRLDSKPPSLELRRAKPATLRPRSRCATICDRVVRGREEHARSDIDLLVVGDAGLADVTPAVRKAEARLSREVHVTSYSAAEFRRKAAAKEHFLSEVLCGPKQFVKGDQRDVDDLIGKPRRSAASDVEARAR